MIFAAAPATPLTRTQLAWLAALVLCAQLPLWIRVPLWLAAAGAGLVVGRLALPVDRLPPPKLRRWLLPLLAVAAAVGIRLQFGYFLARDPCVVFLYLLVGIRYVEDAEPARRRVARLPRRVLRLRPSSSTPRRSERRC